jgi:biopolymer transport protein ExbD
MGSKSSGDGDLMADINITPFVDIILVVLIIFMVTATTIAKSSIKVTLPDAATGEATESSSVGLTLTKEGALLLDGEPVTTDQLKDALRAAKAGDQDVVCLIAADKEVSHGRVVWLIDLVKSEGIAKFAINIDQVDAIPPDPAGPGDGIVPVRSVEP